MGDWRDFIVPERGILGSAADGLKSGAKGLFGKNNCFTEGTQVVVGFEFAPGTCTCEHVGVEWHDEECEGVFVGYVTVNIEDIEIGDTVLSCDPFTQEWCYATVTNTFEKNYTGDVVLLEFEGVTIEAAGGHPFWVIDGEDMDSRPIVTHINYSERVTTENGRWVNARDLKSGDVFLDYFGNEYVLNDIAVSVFTTTVYNIEVSGTHSYTVTSLGVLVHNTSPGFPQKKIPKLGSGKERSTDVPSWVRGERPYVGENGNDFVKRLLDQKYGKGNWKKGTNTEFNKIRKHGDRGFTDPPSSVKPNF